MSEKDMNFKLGSMLRIHNFETDVPLVLCKVVEKRESDDPDTIRVYAVTCTNPRSVHSYCLNKRDLEKHFRYGDIGPLNDEQKEIWRKEVSFAIENLKHALDL